MPTSPVDKLLWNARIHHHRVGSGALVGVAVTPLIVHAEDLYVENGRCIVAGALPQLAGRLPLVSLEERGAGGVFHNLIQIHSKK